MKKLIALALVLVMVFSLVACSGSKTETTEPTTGGETTETKSYKIGVIYTAMNAFWDAVGNGAEDAAAELKAEGIDVEIYALGPQDMGAAGQIQIFEDMMSQGYDGIIISASDSAALTPVIDAAWERGVPVVCMDTECADSKRICFVGTDNYSFGKALGEEIARVLDGKGKVIQLSINPTMTAMAERVRGTEEALAQYPDIELITTFYIQDFSATQSNIEDLAAKYSDFDLMTMNFAGGEQIANVWKAKGWTAADKHAVVSDDLDPIILAVEEGVLDTTLVQGQYNWGYVGVKTLIDYLANGVTPEVFIETPAHVVDADLAKTEYPNVKAAD